MDTRPARVPNVETAERHAESLLRESALAEQQAFLDDFDRQVAELTANHRCRAQAKVVSELGLVRPSL